MSRVMDSIRSIIRTTREKKMIPIAEVIHENKIFENKVALVSGGSGGIGLAIAKTLIESGCKVIIGGTSEKKLEEVLKNLRYENLSSIVINYNETEELKETIEKAINIYGKIDYFISSAGVHTENVDFWNMSPQEFDRVMNINIKGTFFACQIVGAYMRDNRIEGKILLISSSRGSEPAWSPYGISKWGMKGLTLGLAKLFAPYGITVNSIAPGTTATGLIGYKEGDNIYCTENDANRYIMPDEVAEFARFLLSDAGKMVTGETIHISAGRGTYDIR